MLVVIFNSNLNAVPDTPQKGDLNGLILISELLRSQYQCIELHTYHIQVIYTAYKHIAG